MLLTWSHDKHSAFWALLSLSTPAGGSMVLSGWCVFVRKGPIGATPIAKTQVTVSGMVGWCDGNGRKKRRQHQETDTSQIWSDALPLNPGHLYLRSKFLVSTLSWPYDPAGLLGSSFMDITGEEVSRWLPTQWPFLTYPLIYFCQVLGDFRFEDWLVSQVHRFPPQSAQEWFIVCWLGRIKVRQTHRTCPSIRLCYEGQRKIYWRCFISLTNCNANTTCCLEKKHLKTINHEGGFDMKQTWTRVVKK
jgi:hypothetical protein